MTTEIICAVISMIGMILSGLIAWFVSKDTANKEIEKMLLSWNREDQVSSEEEFSEMVRAITRCIQDHSDASFINAVERINSVRLKESINLASNLAILYHLLVICRADNYRDCSTIEEYLSEAINQKRKEKRQE